MRKAVLRFYLALRGVLLSALRPFTGRGAPNFSEPTKVLLIRIDRIGDMVMTMPAAREIKKKFPRAKVYFLAGRVAGGLLSAAPHVDGVFEYPEGKGLAAKLKLIAALRAERFSLAVDFVSDYTLRTALLALLSGAALRLGYDIAGRGVFFNMPVKPELEGKHTLETVLGLLGPLGIDTPDARPELFVPGGARVAMSEFLAANGVAAGDLAVAMHPGGYYPSQRWMQERFGVLLAWLIEEYRAKVLVIGSSTESALVDSVASFAPAGKKGYVIKTVGRDTGDLSALLERCSLFFGNNSGPLHMACALGLPCVSTMGPTDPVKWRPLCARQAVLRASRPCAPCNLGYCEEHGCMKEISTEMAKDAIRSLIGPAGTGKKD